MNRNFLFILFVIFTFVACGQTNKSSEKEIKKAKEEVKVPVFEEDSAYAYTFKQVSFGPRVPNSSAHVACGDYLASKLKEFGASVFEQHATLKTYDGISLNARNIIGSFQPENKNRVLLFAHWDTRPFADRDEDPANYRSPIDGANDGAGACAALLEIARQIGQKQPQIGVDIIFFDAEDWGVPEFDMKNQHLEGWCLGSEFWSKNPHVKNYSARYGILLDMVSAPNARFYKEQYSIRVAANIIRKVWEASQILGYDQYFVDAEGGAIEDDHVHVIRNLKIPCIDIIDSDPNTEHGFGHYWHTKKDNMDHVSKETLKAVGQTVMYVIYHEK